LSSGGSDHWKGFARQWSLLGPPLRPSPADVDLARDAIRGWIRASGRAQPTLLVLGVTAELCALAAGEGCRVVAVDRSRDIIGALWRPPSRTGSGVVCADWCHMPLATDSVDLVLGDGSFTLLDVPVGYPALCAELQRVVRARGACILRCFVQADVRESVLDVFAELERGRIKNYHALRFRLAMALQTDARSGVALGAVYDALSVAWPDLDALADRFGWSREQVHLVDGYRESEVRYSFPTLGEYEALFRESGFELTRSATADYELGERFPTLVLERR
jgi:hypothetical protein